MTTKKTATRQRTRKAPAPAQLPPRLVETHFLVTQVIGPFFDDADRTSSRLQALYERELGLQLPEGAIKQTQVARIDKPPVQPFDQDKA